jgi:hypothetical protein
MAVKVKTVADSLQIEGIKRGEDSEPRGHPRGVRLGHGGRGPWGLVHYCAKMAGKHNCRREKTA